MEEVKEAVAEEVKEEPKAEKPKAKPKAKPKVDRESFVKRKLAALNRIDDDFLARRLAERLRRY